jgi:hypothetical protein
MSAEEPIGLALGGGWEAGPVRIGDTVRRRSGRWTPAVHALLRHLESVGFDAAPRVLGVDGQGREVLSYIEGQAGVYPLPERLWSDAVLDQAARLLRRYHDATVGFVPPVDASWLHGVREPVEVICHGDMAPYNCIYRGDTIIGFIDFDWAGPGPRLWTSRRRPIGCSAHQTGPTSTRPLPLSLGRLRFVTSAGRPLRRDTDAVVERERWQIDYIIAGAEAGDPVQQQCLAAGHVDILATDLAHIHRYRDELDAALA